ncbi:protein NRT1/ PTR FAMILY 5.4-like isoform X2 [Prosopis cineraria]|uniref:protein NRT1/ PTR FAMILY 5.4-like isoform X2 n=1 Tax=Prosopis cineraria TaxID=364024 RepID=UPI00240FE5FA|nr:protein NRT1/ PTR FAMILY 5.4-like isoform X2 [Prosopis cineraria]
MVETTSAPIQSSSSDHDRPSRGGWHAAMFIIFVEMAERFAFYGLSGNLVSYLTNVLGETTPEAAKNVNTWGMILLTLSVAVIPMHSRKLVFFMALYILAIGEGGHKPSVQTFAADQFDEDSPHERMAKISFFNWWYFGLITGAVSAILVVVYLQDNVGWTVGFGILAAAIAVAFGIFLLGINKYRKQGPLGSPFTMVAQVLVAAFQKRHVDETRTGRGVYHGKLTMHGVIVDTKTRVLARTKHFRFLDKAMIIDEVDASSNTTNPWRLCSLNQVEEMKLVLGLIPIWLTCLYFNLVQAQSSTFFTKQGSTMIRSLGPHFTIPPASLQCISGFVVIIFIPIYDRFLVPIARKFTGKPTGITMLQRIGIGLFLSALTMFVAALAEFKRLKVASDHTLLDSPKAIVPIRVWWMLPQYMLLGFVDALSIVGLQHLCYDQMPEALRSLGAAFYISNAGVANFISSAMISIVEGASRKKWLGNNLNRSHLHYYYFLLAGIGVLNLSVYVVVAKRYVYEKVEEYDERKEEMIIRGSNERHNEHDEENARG